MCQTGRILVAGILVGTLAASPARAQAVPDRTDRVMNLARAWATVKFFHPYLAHKDIDWDAAFIAALPKVEAATTIAGYRAAFGEMLGKLGDPVTQVHGTPDPKALAPTGDRNATPAPGIVVIDLVGVVSGGYDFSGFRTHAERISGELAQAKVAVIDLRAGERSGLIPDVVDNFVDALPAIDEWPLQRSLEHRGWRTQDGWTSGGYSSAFIVDGSQPVKAAPAKGPSHVVFVADAHSSIPRAAIALQAAGRATIVSSGPISEANIVATGVLDVGGGLTVEVRFGELLWGPPRADVRAADPLARGLALAKTLIGKRTVAKPRKLRDLPSMKLRDDLDYPGVAVPSRAHRMLAAVRVWATLEYFFPYRDLISDWDGAFRDALPKLEAATDPDRYLDALRELGARAGDGHIGVWSAAKDARKLGIPPLETRLIEKQLVVTRIIGTVPGVAIGDVVETVDGKPVAAVMALRRPTTSGSNDEARDQRVAASALRGADGTTVALRLRAPGGQPRQVSLQRQAAHWMALGAPAQVPHWKKLPNQIGYVDLRLLTVPEVPAMFAELKDTRAIVFDMRGYPNGTAWTIAPRVNTKRAKHGAQFLKPMVTGRNRSGETRIRFLQGLARLPENTTLYTGKIVVLIDDRAISQSEHTCLFLQEAAGATFIGSPTAGANGDVTASGYP